VTAMHRYSLGHINEDDSPPGALNPDLKAYVVDLRNATGQVFDEVVLFYRRSGMGGVVFLGATGFAPNAILSLALGRASKMAGYTVGFFLHQRMVARLPEDGGEMNAVKAAALDPNRLNAWTDSWAIYEQNLIDLSQFTYTVTVRNDTPDKWDSVALSYLLDGETAQILETGSVAVGAEVSFPIGPASKLVGYNFAVFVDGLAVDFDPDPNKERKMFPISGSMSSYRSLVEHATPDWQPWSDVWVVGA
jgi:hypothetical protein